MTEHTGLWSALWKKIDPLVPDEQIAAGAHALSGAVKRSAQGGLLHNVAAIPGAFAGAILRELQPPKPPPQPQPPGPQPPYDTSDIPPYARQDEVGAPLNLSSIGPYESWLRYRRSGFGRDEYDGRY